MTSRNNYIEVTKSIILSGQITENVYSNPQLYLKNILLTRLYIKNIINTDEKGPFSPSRLVIY